MNRDAVLKLLRTHKSVLERQFGIVDIALFGSTARDEVSTYSDIDILVSFDGPTTSERYFGVQSYLEDLLASPIDLVTSIGLRPELRTYIEEEAVYA